MHLLSVRATISRKMLINNKFEVQTLNGSPTGNSHCHALASLALNMSCSFGRSARSIESRCMVFGIGPKVFCCDLWQPHLGFRAFSNRITLWPEPNQIWLHLLWWECWAYLCAIQCWDKWTCSNSNFALSFVQIVQLHRCHCIEKFLSNDLISWGTRLCWNKQVPVFLDHGQIL